MDQVPQILEDLKVECGKGREEISKERGVGASTLLAWRSDRIKPWSRLEKVLNVMGYELEIVKK